MTVGACVTWTHAGTCTVGWWKKAEGRCPEPVFGGKTETAETKPQNSKILPSLGREPGTLLSKAFEATQVAAVPANIL